MIFTFFVDSEQTKPFPEKYLSTQQPTFHRSYNDIENIEPKKENHVINQSRTSFANLDSNLIYTTLPRNYKLLVNNNNETINKSTAVTLEKHKKCYQCCQNNANASRFFGGKPKHFKSTPELANLNKIINVDKICAKEMEDQKGVKIYRNHDYVFLKNYDHKREKSEKLEHFEEQKSK